MMDDIDGLDALESEAKALEQTLGSMTAMTDAFDSQLGRMKATLGETTRDLGNLERGFSGGLRKAFDGLVFDGRSLSDALATVGEAMSRTVYNNALKPVTDHFGGLLAGGVNSLIGSLSPFESGGAFSQGRVMPFAKGGVVSGATSFPMRGGTGLMGEAGPEAIMPLTRGADGSLGVKAQGGQAVNITMNISTPDVAGFKRSQSQIAASVGRALGRGQRNR
jgi:phage-related minor tail protein